MIIFSDCPVIRDPDGHIYFREKGGCVLAGGFEPVAKPAFEDGHLPTSSKSRQLQVDWDHFYVLLESILKRLPPMETAVLGALTNGPEACKSTRFSPTMVESFGISWSLTKGTRSF